MTEILLLKFGGNNSCFRFTPMLHGFRCCARFKGSGKNGHFSGKADFLSTAQFDDRDPGIIAFNDASHHRWYGDDWDVQMTLA